MRRLILLAGSALALGVLVSGSALSAANGTDLPIKGSSAGFGTANLATFPVVHSHVVTTGEVSHFGLTTFVQDATNVFAGPTVTWTGTWTATTANGDQMFGTSTGSGSTGS